MDSGFPAKCIAKAKELTRCYESTEPPYRLTELLAKYDVSEVRERPIIGDARLRIGRDGFVVELNSLFPQVRRRLSLAHEIAHLILNDCAGRELFYSGHSDSESEDLCNHVAGELLVPDWALVSYLNSNPVFEGWVSAINADTVLHAAAAFEVSVEVMAKRIFRDLKLAPNRIAVIWRYSANRKSTSPDKKLRISAAWHSADSKIFVPLNKTVSSASLVFHAYETGARTRGREVIDLGSTKREFFVDAAAYPPFSIGGRVPPTRAVLSLLTPS